ncbi:MAG: F0F1 ATP synthase subunit gamma, partial [Candidatus Competibacteraceae bacterium]
AGYGLSALYHSDASGGIRLRRLLPLRDLPPAPVRTGPPELNLSPADCLAGLTDHYLYAALNEVLYSSLMAENRRRLVHMDRALDRLDADMAQLRLAYNRQRQEEIIEEIEVILLSADLLAGEESPLSNPV